MGPTPELSSKARVSSLISPSSRDWDLEKIRSSLPAFEKEILSLKVSKRGARDKWVWLPSVSGEYSSKSGYYEALKDDPEKIAQPEDLRNFQWRADIWKLHTSAKTKLLLWKAVTNALPVGENLKSRNINPTAVCPYCNGEESVTHLFFNCVNSLQVWQIIPCIGDIVTTQITTVRQGLERAKGLVCLLPTGLGEGPLYPWILWSIWNARNEKIFKDKTSQPSEILNQAIQKAKDWQAAQIKPKSAPPPKILLQTAHSSDLILCNIDAAWKDNRLAGLGWLFNPPSVPMEIQSSTVVANVASPLMAEALALLAALQHAATLGFSKISLASDSAQLIKALSSEFPPMELHGILHDILDLSSFFGGVSFMFTPRDSNRLADAIAKAALRSHVIVSSV